MVLVSYPITELSHRGDRRVLDLLVRLQKELSTQMQGSRTFSHHTF